MKLHVWVVVLVVACRSDPHALDYLNGSGSSTGSGSAVAKTAGSATTPPPTPAPEKTDWKAGDVIQVKNLSDHLYYEAQIVNAGETYKVVYSWANQVEDNVDKARIRNVSWKAKDSIEILKDGTWQVGKVVAKNDDKTYDVSLPSGDLKAVPPDHVRALRKPKSSGGGGGQTSSSNASCPGPGITRRCGGVCVNLQTDDNNCGSCGTRCSGGKHCDGHLFCRDAAGNL